MSTQLWLSEIKSKSIKLKPFLSGSSKKQKLEKNFLHATFSHSALRWSKKVWLARRKNYITLLSYFLPSLFFTVAKYFLLRTFKYVDSILQISTNFNVSTQVSTYILCLFLKYMSECFMDHAEHSLDTLNIGHLKHLVEIRNNKLNLLHSTHNNLI